ncbi:MAG: hypothetical protein H6667_00585 [Ardenticatenaceae bacterium]|nr:hypothetical protein [Ardenticatenaceae bacterium]
MPYTWTQRFGIAIAQYSHILSTNEWRIATTISAQPRRRVRVDVAVDRDAGGPAPPSPVTDGVCGTAVPTLPVSPSSSSAGSMVCPTQDGVAVFDVVEI